MKLKCCGSDTDWCKPGCSCYGCNLRQKNIREITETGAGYTYGRRPLILSDEAKDQRIDAMQQLDTVSKRMQKGGAVVEDALQGAVDTHQGRIKAASEGYKSPLDSYAKLEKSAQSGKPVDE